MCNIYTQNPRVSDSRSRRQYSGQGSHQHLARKNPVGGKSRGEDSSLHSIKSQSHRLEKYSLNSAEQSLWGPMPRGIRMVWSSTLVCRAQLSQQ